MKKITVKVITVFSQILVVFVFLLSLFFDKGNNDNVTIVYNNNFDKMADRTVSLFEDEFVPKFIEETEVDFFDNIDESLEDKEIFENIIIEETVVQESKEEEVASSSDISIDVIEEYTGILTGYGPDCVGCGNFNTGKVSTASGYHVSNIVDGKIEPAFTVTYNDVEYGEVRIVAADDNIPFYSIIRITIPGQEAIMSIVLDRGSTVGFENCRSSSGCLTNFDLLYPTEAESLGKTENVKFELLRSGK